MLPETERAIIGTIAAMLKAGRYALAGALLTAATYGIQGLRADAGAFWFAVLMSWGWGLLEGLGGNNEARRRARGRGGT